MLNPKAPLFTLSSCSVCCEILAPMRDGQHDVANHVPNANLRQATSTPILRDMQRIDAQ
jgi:hypothetical protein